MRNIIYICVLLSGSALANPKQDIENTIKTHVETTNAENLTGVLSTLDSKCPDYPQQAAMMPNLFEQFDLKYSLEKLTILNTDETTATVTLTICTEKQAGPAFRNNRIQQLVTLNNTNNGWKLCSGKIMNIQYLDIEPKNALAFGIESIKCKPSL